MTARNPVREEYHRRFVEAGRRIEGGGVEAATHTRKLEEQIAEAQQTIDRLSHEKDRLAEQIVALRRELYPDHHVLRPTRQIVLSVTADVMGVPIHDMLSDRRARDVAFARQVAAYVMHRMTYSSLPQIGKALAGRDHTTALHAVRKVTRLVEDDADEATIRAVEAIESGVLQRIHRIEQMSVVKQAATG